MLGYRLTAGRHTLDVAIEVQILVPQPFYTGEVMTIKIEGQLEVDPARGVLYFHSAENGISLLRICGLKKELLGYHHSTQLDISHQDDSVMVSRQSL